MNNEIIKKIIKLIVVLFISLFFLINSNNYTLAEEPIAPWTITTSLPFDLASFPSTVYLDKLFTFGGATTFVRQETISSSILSDGSLLNWNASSSVPLPQSLFWHSLIQNGSYVYILGGAIYPNDTVSSINNVYRGTFDPDGNITSWEEMAPLPKRLAFGSAVISQNKIYYSGGGTWTSGGSPVLNDQIFMSEIGSNGEISSWQTLSTTLPFSLFQHSLINTGQKFILIGGTNSPWVPLANVYSASVNSDGTLGNWAQLAPIPSPARAFMANKIGDLIVLAGGVSNPSISDDVFYSEIDNSGNTGNWVTSTNKLPTPNHSAGSTVWKDYLYILGGNDGTKYINSAWVTKIKSSTPTPPTPIVFLPGLGGSINFKEMFLGIPDTNGWKMTPGARTYDNILKTFEGNSDFHVFYYDWRKPVLETAQRLNDYIRNTVNPPENKVDLIGHSLGGLIARTCVQKTEENCYADKLIMVGSPNLGAIDAYPALEGGEVWRTGLGKLGFEILIHYFQKPGETKRETVERIAPVLKDLLPNFDYLTKNGSNLSPSSLSFQNSLLPNLSDLSSLSNLSKTISGRGFNSIEQIVLTEPNWIDKLLGNWPDGKPLDKQVTLEGDATVLTKSASFTDPLIENFSYDLDHGGIISEQAPLSKIKEILGLELGSETYGALQNDKNFLVFFIHSPVKITSPDITPESFVTEELIIIPNPQNKNYTLNIEGMEDNYYSLSIGQIFGEKVLWYDYFDKTLEGKKQSLTFSINQESPTQDPLVDPDGTLVTNQLTSRINEFKKEIQDLKISQFYKNILIDLLNKIQFYSKNPEKSFPILSALRQTIDGYEKRVIIDQDLANIFRQKSSGIADSLEFLCFIKPKKTSKFEALVILKATEKISNSINQKKLSRNGALVFLEALEKLDMANEAFEKSKYYNAKIFALEAGSLFLESKTIK